MSLDDPRLQWIRDRVYCSFSLADPALFDELLSRNDGEHEDKLLRFLNESTEEEGSSAMFFFKRVREEEVEVEIAVEPEELLKVNNISQEEDIDSAIANNDTEEHIKPSETKTDDVESCSNTSEVRTLSDSAAPHTEADEKKNMDITSVPVAETFEEITPIALTKTILQKVYRTVLYASFNCIPDELSDSSALFFLRDTHETIPEPSDMQEANDVMPKFLEYGMLNGHPLLMLQQVISQVYMPLLAYNQHRNKDNVLQGDLGQLGFSEDAKEKVSAKHEETNGEFISVQLIRDEFLMNMQKFLNHVQQTIQQLEGEIKLEMPDVNLDDEPTRLASDQTAIEKLEQCVMNWQAQMSAALEELLQKKPQGKGPLFEIDFWRERNATLSALIEQLKLPTVKKVFDILSIAEPGLVQNLDLTVSELTKYHVEAADNVRFLTTLERHLKNLTHGTGFNVVLETIPPMMNALRMVWIISRHYNKDERMVPLMERIAWEIAERVCRVLNIRSLFRLKGVNGQLGDLLSWPV